MCEALELGLALLGGLAIGMTRWAVQVGRDIARVMSAPTEGPPRAAARGYEEEWNMV